MSRHTEPATDRHHAGAQRPARRSSHDRKLQHGTRVVAVARLTATTVEVLGHGVYEHAPASAAVRQRLAEALEAADQVAVDYEPMLESLSRYMSVDRAKQFRSQFHSRSARRKASSERAHDLSAHVRTHRVRLDHGTVVDLDTCVAVPVEDFAAYASGCSVVPVSA